MTSPTQAAARSLAEPFIVGLRQTAERTGMPQLGASRPVPIAAFGELSNLIAAIYAGTIVAVLFKSTDGVPWFGIGMPEAGGARIPLYIRADFMGAVEFDPDSPKAKLNASTSADIVVGVLVSLIVSDVSLACDDASSDVWVFALDAPIKECAPSILPIAKLSVQQPGSPVRTDDTDGFPAFMDGVTERFSRFMKHLTELERLAQKTSPSIILPH